VNIFRIVIETQGPHDGCSREKGFYIETNALSPNDVISAYNAGAEKVGVDIQKILKDGRGSSDAYGRLIDSFGTIKPLLAEGDLEVSVAPKLMELYGRKEFAKDADLEPEEYENDFLINTPEYFLLWRAIARIGNPDLILNEADHSLDVEIGGHPYDFS
jgi:hypothetical protein